MRGGAGVADGGGQGLDPQQVRGAHDAGKTPLSLV
eukprot:COSAG06_NODE_63691_length_261_cov_1.500000_1_plen_34_part_10